MRKGLFVVLVILFLGVCVPVQAQQEGKGILKAIVKVHATIPADAFTASTLGTEREGNGVVIDSNGYILTIGYLIAEAENIEVTGPEDKPVSAAYVGYDYDTGFGLLKTEKPLNVEPMKLGQSAELKDGEMAIVAGYGGGDAIQIARVISRKEFAGYWEYLLEDAILIAPAYANFGGAALIGREGQLLGIGSLLTQMTIPGLATVACNVFIPIDLLNPILSDLKTMGRPRRPSRPWLGINAEEVHGRVFITKVIPGGPAEEAGLKAGDIILGVNKVAVNGLADFYRKLWATGSAGVRISLSVLQGMEIQPIQVNSADRYQFLRLRKPERKI